MTRHELTSCASTWSWWLLFGVNVCLGCGSQEPSVPNGNPDVTTVDTTDVLGWVDSEVDTATDLDGSSPLPGTFGAPCQSNEQCDSNYCVSGVAGKVCTRTCVEDCPKGFDCSGVKTGSDLVYICLPSYGQLCDPCATNADCNNLDAVGNVCVPFGPDGSFCGVACGPNNPCPDTHQCQTVIDPATGSASAQCLPTAGQCACSPKAIALQLSTKCVRKNLFGACEGVRTCESTGLSACAADVPKAEECNGLDDDCDGQTDNMDETAQCKRSNEHGTCVGVLKACVNGQPQCDAKEPAPETCNGLDDDCDGVTDNTSQCDDGNPCTKDQCNTSGSCKHSPFDGQPCDDGDVCTANDACAGGSCQPGTPKDCDDGDPCSKDSCAPLTGCVHTAQEAVCPDDGDPCTQDLCKSGKCTHPPSSFAVPCAEDGNPCTADVCDKGGCTHQPLDSDKSCLEDGDPCTQDVCSKGQCTHPPAVNGSTCLDDGKACTVDQCAGGKCVHTPKAGQACEDDGNPCTQDLCESGGACGHPPAVNKPCEDDGNPCTQDICQNKLCKHPYSKAPCSDNDPCTVTDYCDLGKCKGINMLKCDDGNPCTNDKCATGSGCTHVALNGMGCTDGNACTSGDTCTSGKCVGKGNDKCDDGNPCTDDGCSAGGACTYKANNAPCADDGKPCTDDVCASKACSHPPKSDGVSCGAAGGPCTDGVCASGTCQQKANNNVCDDGDACTSNDTCVDGQCKGTAFKSCDDGNPCTKDSCDSKGKCVHTPQGEASCKASSGECPMGICQGGSCVSQPGVVCEAKYKADLCSTVKVAGTCTAAGKCVVSSAPPAYTCPGCNGICVKCLIFQFCIPLF